MSKLTKAQRRGLEYVAGNSGHLYGSRRDFRPSGVRRSTLANLIKSRLIEPPAATSTRTWELTTAGRAALTEGEGQ